MTWNVSMKMLFLLVLFLMGCEKAKTTYEYYSDGKISSEYIQTGNETVTKRYTEDGHIWQVRVENQEKIISDEYFHKNGKLAATFPHENGKINGMVKEFYDDGALFAVTQYNYDRIIGSQKIFHKSGSLFCKIDYELVHEQYPESSKYGDYDIFNENGNIIATGIFKYGHPWSGTFTSSDENKIVDGHEERFLLEYEKGTLIKTSVLDIPVIKEWLPTDKEITNSLIKQGIHIRKKSGTTEREPGKNN